MHITADRERCVGAGQCVLAAPAVFDQDDDGLVAPLTVDPSGAQMLRDGKVLAETPDALKVPTGETWNIVLHKEGFVDQPLTVDPAAAEQDNVRQAVNVCPSSAIWIDKE